MTRGSQPQTGRSANAKIYQYAGARARAVTHLLRAGVGAATVLVARAIDWTPIGVTVLICASLVTLLVGLFGISPIGWKTVQTLKDLVDSQSTKITVLERERVTTLAEHTQHLLDKDEAIHQAEKEILEREKTIATLEARPDMATIAESQAEIKIMVEALQILVDRNKTKRSTDQ